MTLSLLNRALNDYASQQPESTLDLFQPNFVKVGAFEIRYVKHEKEGAPILVMLNGLPQSIRMWESAWPALTEHFNLLAFDIPGFGLSQAKESDMSPSNLSDVVVQVFNHFNIKKAHLIGPDVGVPITLATAIKYPERLASINIFDGPGHYPPYLSPILNMVIKSRFVRWSAKTWNKKSVMKTNFLIAVKDGYDHYRPNKRAINEYYGITHNEQSHKTSISFFATYQKELAWIEQHLPTMDVPTLITWGKKDPFVLVNNTEQLSKMLPNNKLKIFANASHFSSEDAGDEYTDTLINWCLTEYSAL